MINCMLFCDKIKIEQCGFSGEKNNRIIHWSSELFLENNDRSFHLENNAILCLAQREMHRNWITKKKDKAYYTSSSKKNENAVTVESLEK